MDLCVERVACHSSSATLANAEIKGVKDRIELDTSEMTVLPFNANSLDAIVSSLAIYNIPGNAGRWRALAKVVRPRRRRPPVKATAKLIPPRWNSCSSNTESSGPGRGYRRPSVVNPIRFANVTQCMPGNTEITPE